MTNRFKTHTNILIKIQRICSKSAANRSIPAFKHEDVNKIWSCHGILTRSCCGARWILPKPSGDAAPRPNLFNVAVGNLEWWKIAWKCYERRGNVRECEEM
jgi:hypothetical protein